MPDFKNCPYPNYEESCFTGSEAVFSTSGDSDIHSGDHRNLKFHTAQSSSQNSTESEKLNSHFMARFVEAWHMPLIDTKQIYTTA